MDKYWNMSEFQEWYDKEIKRSYLVYDYNEQYFERSKIHTYQNVTGSECLLSSTTWGPLIDGSEANGGEGYIDTCGIYGYTYNVNEMDQYADYLKGIGFTYQSIEERRNWDYPGASYYYLNEFTGVEVVMYVFEDETIIFIEARI